MIGRPIGRLAARRADPGRGGSSRVPAPSRSSSPDGAAPSPAAVLELVDVVKEYPGSPPVRALDGVSLRVEAGELVAIVGPSGSGKSTLMNVIGTLDRPTGGRVLVDGTDVAGCSDEELAGVRAARIGFVFQQFHLLEGATVTTNVANGLLYRGVRRDERVARAEAALGRVGLGDRRGHRPPALSGGERQRVAIARALVGDPAIVLADEPTGNLDSRTSAEIVGLLRHLHAEGSTIVVITHDRELAASLPRCVSVSDGAVVGDVRTPVRSPVEVLGT